MLNKILKMFLILLCLMPLLGCNNQLMYIGDSNQVNLSGFKITPNECSTIVTLYRKEHLNLIKKTVDGYYRDDRYYYVVDSFFGSTASSARKYGIKVNGFTGEVYDNKTQTWLPNPLINKNHNKINAADR